MVGLFVFQPCDWWPHPLTTHQSTRLRWCVLLRVWCCGGVFLVCFQQNEVKPPAMTPQGFWWTLKRRSSKPCDPLRHSLPPLEAVIVTVTAEHRIAIRNWWNGKSALTEYQVVILVCVTEGGDMHSTLFQIVGLQLTNSVAVCVCVWLCVFVCVSVCLCVCVCTLRLTVWAQAWKSHHCGRVWS